MTEELPDPLVPADVDLTGMPFMPLDVQRLLDSELWLTGTAEECKAAVTLWCKAWQQRPAASLPDNDKLLASYSATGPRWAKVKKMALHGFVRCRDGRLYHAVVAEKAIEAWQKRLGFQERTRAANEKRRLLKEQRERDAQRDVERDEQRNVGRDERRDEERNDQRNVQRGPNVTSSKGQGQGQGQSPLPPSSRQASPTNGAGLGYDPVEEIAGALGRTIEHFWGGNLRKITDQDRSFARLWLERGASEDALKDLFHETCGQMFRAGKPPPVMLKFFANSVERMIGGRAQ